MESKEIGIAVAVAVLILSIYIFLGVKHKSWNPMSGTFWTGKSDRVEECPPGKAMIDASGTLVACNGGKEGFVVTPSGYNGNVWRSTPIEERTETNRQFLQNLLRCDLPEPLAGLYCDINKPFVFWFNKSVLEASIKNSVLGKPTDIKTSVEDLLQNGENYLKIDTYESLQTMWNDMYKIYSSLNDDEKEYLKNRIETSKEEEKFRVVWEGEVKLQILTKPESQGGVWVDGYPGKTIPWGLFVLIAGMGEIFKGNWRELTLHKDLSGPIREPPHGIMLYRSLKLMED